MGTDKRCITIDDEDILNLTSAIDKLMPTAEAQVDLEIFTLKSIIKKYEEEDIEEQDPCPECGAPLRDDVHSGIKCSKCDYWFCF